VACDACHSVPVNVTDRGHIDHLPPAVVTTECNRCHLAATVDWTGGADEAACGTCHGVPPTDGVHWATMRLTDCATCHPQTMDPSGALKPATHINGVVDVR
jgi:NAD-dependent dihydropyrimidine dehydrogenase PreA subunit